MEKSLFTLSKSLGVVPFQHDSQVPSSCTDHILMIFWPIIYWICYVCTCCYSGTFEHILGCPQICFLGHHIFLHLGAAVYFISYWLSIRKKNFYSNFQYSLNDIDLRISKCVQKIAEDKPKRIGFQTGLCIVGVALFSTAIIFDAYNLFTMLHVKFLLLIFTYAYPFFTASVVQAQFIACIHAIAMRFINLNGILEAICEECDAQKPGKIILYDIESEFRTLEKSGKGKNTQADGKDVIRIESERYLVDVFKIHDTLLQIGVVANDEYALQIVFFLTSSFIIIVFGIFVATKVIFLVRGLNKYLDYNATSYVIWGVVFSLITYIVLRMCCRVQKEAKRSALLIHEIMQRKPAFMLGNDLFYNRMKGFTLQFLHWENYFHFNGIGLFQLDYTFIFSAISAATSYLIVLLQFDLTSKLKS